MKTRFLLLFLIFLNLFTTVSVFSEGRTKNLEFIVLLDKSLSMVDKIEDVKTFFKNQILEKSVIPGDQMTLVIFYGKAEILIQKTIDGPQSIQDIETKLNDIHGDGAFTDIGNAIDFTYDLVQKEPTSDVRKHFVLLTDGRQEAPPGSKYESFDFSIKHPFLESAKNIQKSGWKVQILGIGTDTEAANLADEMAGTTTIWSNTQSMLMERPLNFEEELQLGSSPKLSYEKGNPILQLSIDSSGMNRDSTLKIKQVLALVPGDAIPLPLLEQPLSLGVSKDKLTSLTIPLKKSLSPVALEASSFVLQFDGDISVQPAHFGASSGLFFVQPAWDKGCTLVLAILGLSFIIIMRWKILSFYKKMRESQRTTLDI